MPTIQHTALNEHFFLADDLKYTDLPVALLRGHKQWTDAYLLQLARNHGLIFATLDARMASLDDPSDSRIYVLK